MTIKQQFSIDFNYDIFFSRDAFDPQNPILVNVLTENGAREGKAIVIIDGGLLSSMPLLRVKIEQYFSAHSSLRLLAPVTVVIGGEDVKNDSKELFKILELINTAQVDRHAYVIGIGGGAVLDMVGFASAIGHRGIRHVRFPSTVLSQNDSGVGVKNGVNAFNKKNFIGSFYPPFAVINDFSLLQTLHDRDWRAGTSEALKVALIMDLEFFEWLEKYATQIRDRDLGKMEYLITRCAQLHAQHIVGNNDPFETGSSRPLDFGHWAAHKLEQLSDFSIKHGEAVAIGISLDIAYANRAGFITDDILERILHTIENLGLDTFHDLFFNESGIEFNPDLMVGLEEFREHLGGELTITMIERIGTKFDVHEMNPKWLQDAALKLKNKYQVHAS